MRTKILDNMSAIGLIVPASEKVTVEEYLFGIKRALRMSYLYNIMEYVPESNGKYEFKYINCRGEGVGHFKIKFAPCINDVAYNAIRAGIFPKEIIAYKPALEETMAKDKGFSEWRPMAEFITAI